MDKYREEIKKELSKLSNEGCLLFAALICERLYPNYEYFYCKFNWGNPKVLQEAINAIFQFLTRKNSLEKNEIIELIEQVDLITPDADDFSEIYFSFALDACTSVYSTLTYIIDQEMEHIVDVATYARDTVDLFIQEREDIKSFNVNVENEISNDPLMLNEKRRQKNVIEQIFIKNPLKIDDLLIDGLRDKNPIILIDSLK